MRPWKTDDQLVVGLALDTERGCGECAAVVDEVVVVVAEVPERHRDQLVARLDPRAVVLVIPAAGVGAVAASFAAAATHAAHAAHATRATHAAHAAQELGGLPPFHRDVAHRPGGGMRGYR